MTAPKEMVNSNPVATSLAVAAAFLAFFVFDAPWWMTIMAGVGGLVVGKMIGRV